MQPGYFKKTKANSGKAKDGGAYPNMNQVVDKIKEMTQNSAEFYEIEPAEVIRIFLDSTASDFPQLKTNPPTPDLTFLGAVIVRLTINQPTGGALGTSKPIRPISQHIVQYPLKGEVVNIARYIGSNGKSALYYSNPLNLDSRIIFNRLVGVESEGKIIPKNVTLNRKIQADQGDTLFQGRFGQSIHFGSAKDYTNPFVKITAGQSKLDNQLLKNKKRNHHIPHITNINNDGASIYLTTNEHIPLQTDASSQVKTPYLGLNTDGKDKDGKIKTLPMSTIVMNAESIVFNTKNNGDISAFSSRYLTLAARTGINLESEFGSIKIGSVDTVNPAVKGAELVTYLHDFLTVCKAYATAMQAHLSSNKDDAIVTAVSTFSDKFNESLDDLKSRLDGTQDGGGGVCEFNSKKVFVADDRDVKEGDELDLESLWDNTVWNETEEVTTKEYGVEKINSGATGVSG